MNRFQKLLASLGDKIDSMCLLSGLIIEFTQADKAYEALLAVVEILKDPNGAVNKHTTGFVAARAEEVLEMLDECEHRFLVSCSTVDAMRVRIGALHEETQLRRKVSNAITVYDVLRVNPKTSVATLRAMYLEMNGLMVRAEAQSRKLHQRDCHKVLMSGRNSRCQAA